MGFGGPLPPFPITSQESASGVTVLNTQYPPCDVRRFGAKVDGVTDDSTALLNTITSLNGRGTILPWLGTLLVGQQIAIITNGIRLAGAGVSEINATGAANRGATCLLRGFTGSSATLLVYGDDCGIDQIDIDNNLQGTGDCLAWWGSRADIGTITCRNAGSGNLQSTGLRVGRTDLSTSSTITAISNAASAVITISTVQAVNPVRVGDSVVISGVLGMTQINQQTAVVSAVGGVSGAWTVTVPINSTAFGVYTSGGLLGDLVASITGATSANPIVLTVIGHGHATHDKETFASLPGAFGTALNGNAYFITVIDANTFSVPVNGIGFAAYTSGGTDTHTVIDANGGVIKRVRACGCTGDGVRFDDQSSATSLSYPLGANNINSWTITNLDVQGNGSALVISAITKAASAVVTLSTASASHPIKLFDSVNFSGIVGMVEMNGKTGRVTAVGGSTGAWTLTVNIDSTAFTVYTSGGLTNVGDGLQLWNVEDNVFEAIISQNNKGCGIHLKTDGTNSGPRTNRIISNDSEQNTGNDLQIDAATLPASGPGLYNLVLGNRAVGINPRVVNNSTSSLVLTWDANMASGQQQYHFGPVWNIVAPLAAASALLKMFADVNYAQVAELAASQTGTTGGRLALRTRTDGVGLVDTIVLDALHNVTIPKGVSGTTFTVGDSTNAFTNALIGLVGFAVGQNFAANSGEMFTLGSTNLNLGTGTTGIGGLWSNSHQCAKWVSVGLHTFLIADQANVLFNAGYLETPVGNHTTPYTAVLADAGKLLYYTGTGAAAFTIPANSSVAYPVGTELTFVNDATGATNMTIAITTDTMILSPGGTTGSRTLAQFGRAKAVKLTATRWLISGSGLT